MTRVHYFQRYSSIENTVTNNTLQLFGRIYEYSPHALSRLLSELTDQPIYIGIEISQQNRSSVSVPDGSIFQSSFRVSIEAKVDSSVDFAQLTRHVSSFGTEAQKVLLLLTRLPLSSVERDSLKKLQSGYPGVAISSITFENICDAVKHLFKPHEVAIVELVEDYIEYCNDTGLFDQSPELMRIVPCGRSIEINLLHGIYFQPSDRGYSNHAFVGIYSQKAVRAILQLKCVFDVELRNGQLNKQLVQGEYSDMYDHSIRAIVVDAKTSCDYEIESGHRFFCGKMIPTDYRKISPGGIQGARFVNLKDVLGQHDDVADIASRLRAETWE